jgi:hypothetical protein
VIVQVKHGPVWHHSGVQTDQPRWQRSSRCSGGTCVEVAQADGVVWLRDGKRPEREPIVASAEEWAAFVAGVRGGEFDHL